MRSKLAILQCLLPLLVPFTKAQIIANSNGQLPSCANGCTLLIQASQACASSPQPWVCFCQSAYLTNLYNTPVGTCDAFCTNPTDNQMVMVWYQTNCGSDKGASEHPNAAQSPAQGATTTATATTATTGTTTDTSSAVSGTAAAGSFTPVGLDSASKGTWWDNHYKWVVMLIVIFLGLVALTLLFIWLKRRHARKQDEIVGSFNEGITMRSTPMTTVDPVPAHSSSGRDSPIRTRDAFMPYGYGYSRSESRLNSKTNLGEPQVKGSPLAHDGTTLADLEKSAESGAAGKKKRVYVRERSISDRDNPETGRR